MLILEGKPNETFEGAWSPFFISQEELRQNYRPQAQGLNAWEVAQLAGDYQADPEVFELTTEFCQVHVEQRRELVEKLQEQARVNKEVAREDLEYQALLQLIGKIGSGGEDPNFVPRYGKFGRVKSAASSAAGERLWELKDELRKSGEEILAQHAEPFSTAFAQFCTEYCKSKSLVIMGQAYEYHDGVLTMIAGKNASGKDMYVAYATVKKTMDINRVKRANLLPRDHDKVIVRCASFEEWQKLLAELEARTKF